jgi:carbon monoxide dehydrogenase subunit G
VTRDVDGPSKASTRPRPPRFVFRTTWTVGAPAEAVFAVLADVRRYQDWWPDVRYVEDVGGTYRGECRSVLPYVLRVQATVDADEAARRIVVRMEGDLQGELRVEVNEAGGTGRARVSVHQEVELRKVGIARWSWLLAPALRANHRWMMQHGQRGLRGRLGG